MMLSSIIRRNVTRTTLHRSYVSLVNNNYIWSKNQHRSKNSMLQCITSKHNVTSHRHKIYKHNIAVKYLPLLPGYVYRRTSILSNISVFFNTSLLRNSIDPEFDLKSTLECITKVVFKVSAELADQNYDSLEGLVDQEALQSLKERIESLSYEERNVIAIKENETIACMPAFIKIRNLTEDQPLTSATYNVELNAIIYYRARCAETEGKENISYPVILAANYIFTRDYIPNENTDWTIKHINYARKCIFSGF